MDSGKAALVVCLTLFIVIGINAAIYVSFTRKNTTSQIELLRRAAQRARDPWEKENTDLKELSQRVSELKERKKDDQ
jgi:hypothetical protein